MPGVEKKGTTRRDFLKIMGVGGLGAASVYVIGCGSPQQIASTVTKTVTGGPGGTVTNTVTATQAVTSTATATQVVTTTAPAPAVKELAKAIGYVSVKAAYCGGCRTCMAACSLKQEGAVWPEMSLTCVISPVTELFNSRVYACRQCDDAPCVKACPTGAFAPDAKTGARVVDQAKCDGCRLCEAACIMYPNQPIKYNPTTKKVKNCDLCGGDPLCVKFCPQSQDLTKLVTPKGPNGSSYVRPEKNRVRKFIKTPVAANASKEGVRWLSQVDDDNWWAFDGRVGHQTPD